MTLGRTGHRRRPTEASQASDDDEEIDEGARGGCLLRLLSVSAAHEVVNKSLEFCVTLLVVYILIELSALPKGCQQSAACLKTYINETGVGNDLEKDFIMTSCAVLREQCSDSVAGEAAVTGADDDVLQGAYGPIINFCHCLLQFQNSKDALQQGIYCDFQNEQLLFFFVGLILIGLMEASSRKSGLRKARFLFEAGAVGYFIGAIVVFQSEANSSNTTDQARCGSKEFSLSAETVAEISIASLGVLISVIVLESIVEFEAKASNVLGRLICCACLRAPDSGEGKTSRSRGASSGSSNAGATTVVVAPKKAGRGSRSSRVEPLPQEMANPLAPRPSRLIRQEAQLSSDDVHETEA